MDKPKNDLIDRNSLVKNLDGAETVSEIMRRIFFEPSVADSGWHDVNDLLPEENGWYFCCYASNGCVWRDNLYYASADLKEDKKTIFPNGYAFGKDPYGIDYSDSPNVSFGGVRDLRYVLYWSAKPTVPKDALLKAKKVYEEYDI